MKIVITGSLGNISKPLAKSLVEAGNEVSVITSSSSRVAAIESLGAKALVGTVEDKVFLSNAFKGADAVYTMVPPNFGAQNWKAYIASIGQNYAAAIVESGVSKVVNLSSIGAHLVDGCGPVSGIFHVEKALDALKGVDVLHLRAGFFYTNFLANIGMIKHNGIIGGNYGENTSLVLVHPQDIAKAAFEALQQLNFSGKVIKYVVSDEKTTKEVAGILGNAIGKPELPWIDFKDEDTLNALTGVGLSHEIASNYVEMGKALREGKMAEHYLLHKPQTFGNIKLADFAKEFTLAYQS